MARVALPLRLTRHAHEALERRAIPLEWIERVYAAPEKTEADRQFLGIRHYLGRIPENGDRVLRVVVATDSDPGRLVTAYFDRGAKGTL